MKKSLLAKLAAVVVAAAVFVPLMADWVVPGRDLALALAWLEGGGRAFPLWGLLVRLAGYDIAALGAISVVAALVCVWCAASIAGSIIRAAVRIGEKGGEEGAREFVGVESVAVVLAALGFAFAPGVLAAATRVSPLTVSLAPVLAAMALVTGWAFRGGRGSKAGGKVRLVVAALLLGVAAFEFILARRLYVSTVLPPLVIALALSVVPAGVAAWCVMKRFLANRYAQIGAFALWAFVIVEVAVVMLKSGRLDEGRVGNRIFAQIVADAAGRAAIITEGPMDTILRFTRPEGLMRISMFREDDPAYGRELADWVRGVAKAKGEGEGRNVEDLAFAAELGPRALVDEWSKLDRDGFEAAVASVVNYFPTRERLAAAADILEEVPEGDPLAKGLRHLLGVCGNALGCRLIEKGDPQGAWDVFWTVYERIDSDNYTALVNLSGLVERGLKVDETLMEIVKRKRGVIEAGVKSPAQAVRAVRSGGRAYVAPEQKEEAVKKMREAVKKRGLSPETRRFVEAVTNAPKDRAHGEAARNAIRTALTEGRIHITDLGGALVTIDLALGDGASAEKDALALLKADRNDPTANATLGSIAGARGEYERSARYLKRAIATGKASLAAKNDYAYTLMKLGRLDEAEPYAREAVKAYGEAWALHETLAAILIRQGKVDEAAKELARVDELTEKAGIPKGSVFSVEVDRAMILKKKGDLDRSKIIVRALRARSDLSEAQRAELDAL